MSLAKQIAKNTVYQVIGKGLGTAIGLVTVGLMTRYLGTVGFGYYTTIIAFAQFFAVLSDFGLQMVASQLLSHPDSDEQRIFGNVFAWRLVCSIAFLAIAVGAAWLSPYPLIIKEGITLVVFSFFFTSLQSVFISLFQKHLNMAETAVAEIVGRIILLVGVIVAVSGQLSLLWIILAFSLANLGNFAYLYFKSRRYVKPRLYFDRPTWVKIWRLAWPLAITIGLSLIYFRADTLVLAWFRPQSEVGIYGATYKVLEVLIQFPFLFLGLMLPLFVKFLALNKEMFKGVFQKSFDFLAILILPMVFSILILGEPIMVFVAGPEFVISGQLLKILIFAAAMIYWSTLFGYGIVALGLQKKMIVFYVLDAVASIALYLIFIPLYSYWAGAILTVFTELVIAVSSYYIFRKNSGVKLNYKVAGKALLASLVMMAVLVPLATQNLLLSVVIGAAVYLAMLFWLRGVSKEMVLEMIRFRSK